MKKIFWCIVSIMTKELLKFCIWYKIDWKKLVIASTVMTILGILIPTFVLPPLNTWFTPLQVTIPSSHISLNNGMQLTETVTDARLEQPRILPIAPVLSVNSITATALSVDSGKFASNETKFRVSRKKNPVPRRRRKRNNNKFNDDAKVVPPVPPRTSVSRQLQRYIWSLSPKDAVLYARKEIENAPVVSDDAYLYAPIFRNVSVFKRSYELMELILKVYIYPGGRRPIFHVPHLSGIYASEGWFMKFMEENRQFVTKDPEKAHLFYLPYSARQLQTALYVPNSHNLRPLSIFMRDYANMLAEKYPFWNRTRGRDHFLVACHDWGPYTLTMHKELTKNTIKALCNADASEGIFDPSKDVSLPETTIRTPRRPLKNVGGGIRVSQRPILAFFAGNMHGRVRPILLKHWLNKDEDMKIYGPLPGRISRKMSYVQHMKSSRYCICPMGHEVNSPRIVEAIYYECVPVIIADNFALPFSDVLDWNAFSIVVAEKDIPKLKEILVAVPLKRYLTMLTNLKMLQRHFLWNPRPLRYDLFHMILHSIWFSRINQVQISESK